MWGDRLTDGMELPQDKGAQMAFYSRNYRRDVGVLPFCTALSKNGIRMTFNIVSITEMASGALVKVHEVERQRHPFGPAARPQ